MISYFFFKYLIHHFSYEEREIERDENERERERERLLCNFLILSKHEH